MPTSSPRKISRLATLLLVGALAMMVVVWVVRTYLATRLGESFTLNSLKLATVLDPNNEAYQLRIGRFYQYNPADMDPDEAMRRVKRAVDLSPYDPQAWIDLGAALEFQGETAQAEACLRRADYLAPNLPPIQWSIGNFFLLHGNVDEAFRHLEVVLDGSTRYNQAVFDIAWKASDDPSKILDELIPRHAASELAYLSYLVQRRNFDAAHGAWKRIVAGAETFQPSETSAYIDSLIAVHRLDEAYQVWNDLGSKRMIPSTYASSGHNLLLNGDFEETPVNFGFDWRLSQIEGAYTTLDQTTFHTPSHALLIQFLGTQNLNYQNAVQFLRVEPDHKYRLQALVKSQEITTDSGPRLEVRDAYDAHALDQFSDDVRGDNPGWTPLVLDFKTSPKTEFVRVAINRLPSRRFDSLIAGKIWVDDVSLVSSSREQAGARDQAVTAR